MDPYKEEQKEKSRKWILNSLKNTGGKQERTEICGSNGNEGITVGVVRYIAVAIHLQYMLHHGVLVC
jgi:hypothetical protein